MRALAIAATALTLSAAGGCATAPTPDQAAKGGQQVAGGYAEQRLGAGRYHVSFSATTATPRRRLEVYLARRAAELTLQEGFDWFTLGAPAWEAGIYAYAAPDSSYSVRYVGGYDDWRAYWRWYRFGLGWQRYDDDPFWWSKDHARASRRIEVHADVTMGRGPPPPGAERTFLARQVLQRSNRSTGG